jgi:hypothetical protein
MAAGVEATVEAVHDKLSATNRGLFDYLPASIKRQLLADRDAHGNVQVRCICCHRAQCQRSTAVVLPRTRARVSRSGLLSLQSLSAGGL